MSAICNQCIGTSDYRRGPRANVCLIVSPLFCLHGEFGSPCLGFIAFDPVYVCTHYNNSPREGSPVADVDQLGCEGSQTAAAPTPDIRTPETRGGHDSMTSCSGRTPHYPPDNGWVVMVIVCGAVSDRTITQTQTLQWRWGKWYYIWSYKIHFQALNWSQSFER